MLVQCPEAFENCLSAGTVFSGGQNGVLSMKKNGILNKLFKSPEECSGIRDVRKFLVERHLDVAQQVHASFLLGRGSDIIPAGFVDTDENVVVIFTKIVNNHFGSSAFINIKEGYWRIGENPAPVAFPAGLACMYGGGSDCFKAS